MTSPYSLSKSPCRSQGDAGAGGLPVRKIARSLGVSFSSVGDYLNRFAANDLTWPYSLSNAELKRQLLPTPPVVTSKQRPIPDCAWVHTKLHRPGVTLALLWWEYRLGQPQGFQKCPIEALSDGIQKERC